jgi:hypothetical protein
MTSYEVYETSTNNTAKTVVDVKGGHADAALSFVKQYMPVSYPIKVRVKMIGTSLWHTFVIKPVTQYIAKELESVKWE